MTTMSLSFPGFRRGGIILVLAASLLLTLLFRQVGIYSLSDAARHDGETRARAALSVLTPVLIASLKADAAAETTDARRRLPVSQADAASIQRVARDLGLKRIEIHDGRGYTRFVTEDQEIEDGELGEDVSANPGFLGAMTGKPVGDIAYRDELSRFDRTSVHSNVVEYYLPIRASEGGVVLGVFEAYVNADPFVDRMKRTWMLAAAASLTLFSLFYLSRIQVTRNAERAGAARVALVDDAEHRKFISGLHDDVLESLGNVKACLDTVQARVSAAGPPFGSEAMLALGPMVQQSVRLVRSLAISVMPPQVRERGLAVALRTLASTVSARHENVSATIDFIAAEDDIPVRVQIAVYRIVETCLADMATCERALKLRLKIETTAHGPTVDLDFPPTVLRDGAEGHSAYVLPPDLMAQIEDWVWHTDGTVVDSRAGEAAHRWRFRWERPRAVVESGA